MKEDFVTVSEAARLLGVHRTTLYNWEKRGDIKIYRIGRGVARIKIKDIKRIKEAAGMDMKKKH